MKNLIVLCLAAVALLCVAQGAPEKYQRQILLAIQRDVELLKNSTNTLSQETFITPQCNNASCIKHALMLFYFEMCTLESVLKMEQEEDVAALETTSHIITNTCAYLAKEDESLCDRDLSALETDDESLCDRNLGIDVPECSDSSSTMCVEKNGVVFLNEFTKLLQLMYTL